MLTPPLTFVNGIAVGSTNDWSAPRNYKVAPGVLQAGDNDIYDWVSGRAAVPADADTPVLRKLLAFRVRF